MIIADNNLTNSDWIKSAQWDLPFTTVEGFVKFMGITLEDTPWVISELGKLVQLPAYNAAPQEFKSEVSRYLGGIAKSMLNGVEYKYSPDQPRDELGRFGEGDGGKSDGESKLPPQVVERLKQYDNIFGDLPSAPKGYNTPGNPKDERLAQLCIARGFTGKPTVVDKIEGIEIYRGMGDFIGENNERIPASEFENEYKTADVQTLSPFGMYGGGTYFSTDQSTADFYARQAYEDDPETFQPGVVMKMGISEDATFMPIQHDSIYDAVQAQHENLMDDYKLWLENGGEPGINKFDPTMLNPDDQQNWAKIFVAAGFDGIQITNPNNDTSAGSHYIVYNRGILEMEK